MSPELPWPAPARTIDTLGLDRERRAGEQAPLASASGAVNIEDLLKCSAAAFVEDVKRKLEEDTDDARDGGDVAPDIRAVQTCMRLARLMAPHVAIVPRLMWAAFTEDTGSVSLVLQSPVTDRRINCRIHTDGSAIEVVRVNEYMDVETIPVSLTAPEIGRELAKWVTSRA